VNNRVFHEKISTRSSAVADGPRVALVSRNLVIRWTKLYETSHLKRLPINDWPLNTRKVIAIDRHYITSCQWPVVTTSLSSTVSQIIQLMQYTLLPVTFSRPSLLTIKFKSLAMCAFWFMCKYIAVEKHCISCVIGIRYRFQTAMWPLNSLKVIGNHAITIDHIFLLVIRCNCVSISYRFYRARLC